MNTQAHIKTASDLKHCVNNAGHESFFFDRGTMRFFGDTMRNYGVRQPSEIVTHGGERIKAYELFRRRSVHYGLKDSAFFCAETFRRVFPANN
jgi:hypothetical protein